MSAYDPLWPHEARLDRFGLELGQADDLDSGERRSGLGGQEEQEEKDKERAWRDSKARILKSSTA